tara:strand:+ start:167 stop:517 length:351 start_codon:yes stop_codon:yes gene_type:complete
MNVYHESLNGVRYSIWALKTVEHPDGGTDSDCQEATDWTNDFYQALEEADCFRATFNAAPPEDPEDWEAVGDYYYDTFDDALDAINKHTQEYLEESIKVDDNANAIKAYYARKETA